MTPVDQEHFYSESPRSYGDCMRASIASILDLPLSEVPHFVQVANGDVYETYCLIEDFLFSRGYDVSWQVSRDSAIRHGYHLMSGPSPRGSVHHMVVGHLGEVCHDPHFSRAGILEPVSYHVIRNFKSTV